MRKPNPAQRFKKPKPEKVPAPRLARPRGAPPPQVDPDPVEAPHNVVQSHDPVVKVFPADDPVVREVAPGSYPKWGYPRWVHGGGVMEGGEQDGETLKDLLLLVEDADEEQAVKAGTAPLTHVVKTASDDVLGIVVKR